MDLPDGYIVRFNALDPNTGSPVAGVVVSNVSIYGANLGTSTTGTATEGPFMLVPGPGA
jgi:hypothetical protein